MNMKEAERPAVAEAERQQGEAWSIREIPQRMRQLWLPHFQRSAVWTDTARAKLLESLWFDTPIGNVLLWQPREGEPGLDSLSDDNLGIPLGAGEHAAAVAVDDRRWIVDGQQRLRFLDRLVLEELCPPKESLAGNAGVDRRRSDDDPGLWCLNLGGTHPVDLDVVFPCATGDSVARDALEREFIDVRNRLSSPWRREGKARQHLFVWISMRDFARQAGVPGAMAALPVPLAVLHGRTPRGLPEGAWPAELLSVYRRLGTAESIDAMLQRTVRVELLRHPRDARGLRRVVETYNRINSAGVPVNSGEREYASLVGVAAGDAADWLVGCFKDAAAFEELSGRQEERAESNAPDALEIRDEAGARGRPSQMGFAFYMRTLEQGISYHIGPQYAEALKEQRAASEYFSHSSNARELRDALMSTMASCRAVCAKVVWILRRSLGCDDWSYLPRVDALDPLVALLYRFGPAASQGHDGLLASLALQLLVTNGSTLDAGPEKGRPRWHPEPLAREILRCSHLGDAVALIDVATTGGPGDTGALAAAVRSVVAAALSPQHPHVKLLYWLLVHREARDWSADHLRSLVRAERGKADAEPDVLKRTNRLALAERMTPWLGVEAEWGAAGWSPPSGPPRIERRLKCQAQHLAPFATMRHAFGLDSRQRTAANALNGIGNLTFISGRLNWELGSWFATPEVEDGANPDNLTAHLLALRDGASALSTAVREAEVAGHAGRLAEDVASGHSAARTELERFCAGRRERITLAWIEWIDLLRREREDRAVDASAVPRHRFEAAPDYGEAYLALAGPAVNRHLVAALRVLDPRMVNVTNSDPRYARKRKLVWNSQGVFYLYLRRSSSSVGMEAFECAVAEPDAARLWSERPDLATLPWNCEKPTAWMRVAPDAGRGLAALAALLQLVVERWCRPPRALPEVPNDPSEAGDSSSLPPRS